MRGISVCVTTLRMRWCAKLTKPVVGSGENVEKRLLGRHRAKQEKTRNCAGDVIEEFSYQKFRDFWVRVGLGLTISINDVLFYNCVLIQQYYLICASKAALGDKTAKSWSDDLSHHDIECGERLHDKSGATKAWDSAYRLGVADRLLQ